MKTLAEFRGDLLDQISKIEDPEEVIRFATESMVDLFKANRCAATEMNLKANRVRVLHQAYRGVPPTKEVVTLSDLGPDAVKTSQKGITLNIADVTKDERTKNFIAAYADLKIAAFIAAPLIRKGEFVASFNLTSSTPRVWTDEEQRFVESIAQSIWSAFEKTRLIKDLRESEQKYRQLFEDSPISIVVIDPKTNKFIDANPATIRHYGYSFEEFTSKTIYDIQDPTEPLQKENLETMLLPKGQLFTQVKKDGTLIYMEITASRTVIAGTPVIIGMANDVTDRILAEKRMRLSEEEAKKANQAKSLFLANMSHEIRTPMNAILGFSSLLKGADIQSAEFDDYIQRIQANSNHLLHLIDDILDVTKVESGELQLNKSEFSMFSALRETHEALNALVKDKPVLANLEYANKIPSMLYSDPFRFQQVLTNLIANAAKFTEKGGITIRVSQEDESLYIDIIDTGLGISEEAKSRLFKHFSQGDNSITRKHGGSGLGLILSRKIAEALGGTLTLCESQEGKGSRFRFQHPIMTVIKEKTPPVQKFTMRPRENPRPLEGMNILVVEDAPDNEALVLAYLGKAGARMEVAHNGREALVKAANKPCDLILMDIQMPVMDGLEATRILRKSGFKAPILALTAHALPEEIKHSLEAGCNFHLTKPINREKLINSILTYTLH